MIWKVYDKTGKTLRCEIRQLEYNGEFMGACSVVCTVNSPVPINFAIGDYLEYRGERFEINYDPTIIKKARKNTNGSAFVYDNVKFNSLSDELARCDFLDYVLNDNQIHFTALPRFSFYASSVKDLADRLQANLDRIYKGAEKWTVTVNPEFSSKTNINVEVSNMKVWDALAMAYEKFGATFTIKGRTITIGSTGITAEHLFQYGKGNGLYEIERNADADQMIVTRLRAYGNTTNLPDRYYNKLSGADGKAYVPDNMAVQNLMLPGFPFDTLDPYIDSKNASILGIREHTIFFDGTDGLEDVHPSLKGMTAQQLQSAGVSVDLDPGDNGNLDEIVSADQLTDNGIKPEQGTIPSTFKITLKDIGFDINKHLTGEAAAISVTNGMCGGRDFEIVKCEKSGNKYTLTCNRTEDSSIGRVFPYKDYNIKPGDKFVILHIAMPGVYIKAASERLKVVATEWLKKNDFARYSYSPKVDDIFMAEQHRESAAMNKPSLHDTIKEGDLMLFEDKDLGINGAVIIDTLSIKEGESSIPKYSVVLKDEKTVGSIQKIQQSIESIITGSAGGGGYNLEQIVAILKSHGAKMFLRKDAPDQTAHLLKLLGGVLVDGGIALLHKGAQYGEYFAGGLTGHGGRIDGAGNGELRSLRLWEWLEVPEFRYNSVKIFIGIDWQCPGAGIVESVTPDVDARGKILNTGTIRLKLEKGQCGSVAVDDIAMGIYHLGNGSDATADTDDGRGNFTFAGFSTIYFRINRVDGADCNSFRYTLRPGFSVHPQPQMSFACYGNFTNTERQASTYRTKTYTRRLWKQNDWEFSKDSIAAQDGDLSNLSMFGLQLGGYSAYLNSIYFTGTIQQLKKPDGTLVQIANERGAWEQGMKCEYYDRVSHNGCIWLCVDKNGTTAEPSKNNPSWKLEVDKGADGGSVTPLGEWQNGMTVPYLGIVRMDGKSWICTAKGGTTEPPVCLYTDESGNPFVYEDGSYIATGDVSDLYKLLNEDGQPGEGTPGPQGIPGCIIRDSEWNDALVEYRNDESLTKGTRYLDVVAVATNANEIGYFLYKCKETHISAPERKPGTAGGTRYWELMSNVGPIFTSLLIAKNAQIKFLQGNRLLIAKEDGSVTAGLSGSTEGDKTRMWAGGNIPDSSPFAVNERGEVTAEMFRTGRNGCRMEALNGEINIYGSHTRNIQFGINKDGMAVLKYYDDAGNLLYDLGPEGIQKAAVREEKWIDVYWTFLSANLSDVFGSKYDLATNPRDGAIYFKYISRINAGVNTDPDNDGRYFLNGNKVSKVQDGWYVKTLAYNVPEEMQRIRWRPTSFQPEPPLHPQNPRIDTSGMVGIYYIEAFRLQSGAIVESQKVFYNWENPQIPITI